MSERRVDSGFTLIEIVIVVVILGILAAVAIPRVVGPNERVKASEAKQILTNLLMAQRSYALENGGSYNNGGADLSALDVTISASQNFDAPTISSASGAVASIARIASGPVYTLSISDVGVITCANAGCSQACKGGVGPCN